jgi:hypothetical protein
MAAAGPHGSGSNPDWTIAYCPVEPNEMMLRTLIREGRSKGGLSGRVPPYSPSPRHEPPPPPSAMEEFLAASNPEIAAGRQRLAYFAGFASQGVRQESEKGGTASGGICRD